MTIRRLNYPRLMRLVEVMRWRDRYEALLVYPTIEDWAHAMVSSSCVGLVLEHDREPLLAGGVITDGRSDGILWFVATCGFNRFSLRSALKFFDTVKGFGGYSTLKCNCEKSNLISQAFAERLGFARVDESDHFITYGMAL